MTTHSAVWIDHKEARVFHVRSATVEQMTMTAPHHNIHHKHPEGDKEHPNDAKRFFHEVALSLAGADGVLIVGPSTAKLEFLRYVHKHDHSLEQRILGVETVDHPTDGQLVAYAKKYFEQSDAMP